MSKILKRTGSAYFINDVGQTVPQDGQLVIDPSYYSIFARSSDTIAAIANGDLVYNDGSGDLLLADATIHLQGLNPKRIDIDQAPPFAAKTLLINGVLKKLFKRVHGCHATISAGQTVNIDFTVPHVWAKFTGAEINNCEVEDTLNFFVLDTYDNDISGLDPNVYGHNVPLNQFGFNVEMPNGPYKNTSDYDADLYEDMVIRCQYTNNGQSSKYIGMNIWLHEVKD